MIAACLKLLFKGSTQYLEGIGNIRGLGFRNNNNHHHRQNLAHISAQVSARDSVEGTPILQRAQEVR